jgi:hypothetical protein
MTFHETMATDLQNILEDDDTGFGWAMTITDPDEVSAEVIGSWTDVTQDIDLGTGVIVAGRVASIVVRQAALTEAGLGMPREVPDEAAKPWRVSLLDTTGATRNYKIASVEPDVRRGLVRCGLEDWEPAA